MARPRRRSHLLHDRDGALAHERNRHWVGTDAVARDAAGGVGPRFHRRRGGAFRERPAFPAGFAYASGATPRGSSKSPLGSDARYRFISSSGRTSAYSACMSQRLMA